MSVIEDMEPLFMKAETEGLWLECRYQGGMIFTPGELRNNMAHGNFRWGPVNWSFVKPQDVVDSLRKEAEEAQKAYENMFNKVKNITDKAGH